MMIRIMTLALTLLAASAVAHHAPDHRVYAIGVETVMSVRVSACDTEQAANLIVTVHRERGFDMARAVAAELQAVPSPTYPGEGLCGPVSGYMTVHEQLAANILPDAPGIVYMVRMSLRRYPGRDYFALIAVDEILPADRAHELTAEST